MSIYARARVKITFGTVLVSLVTILSVWLLLFGVDYVMFTNNMPILFGTTKVEDVDGQHVITEKGLGYYAITRGENAPELYLFGHKIK